jgi:hypothetical protein
MAARPNQQRFLPRWPLLMKLRLKSASIAARSIFLGQLQSKSTMGLVAPMCVARAPLEAALLSLALFDGEHFSESGPVNDLGAAADQPEQTKGFEAGLQLGRCQISGHICRLSSMRRR